MAMKSLPPISNGKIPNILLLGNGLNQAFGEASWSKVIESLSTGEYDYNDKVFSKIKKIPSSLQTILISSDSVDVGMDLLAQRMLPNQLNKEHSALIRRIATQGFDAILTTNYSYEIETALQPDFSVAMRRTSKYRRTTKKGSSPQEQFGIFKYYSLNDYRIWHIHGEAAHPNSMVMGHYYYGKLLAEIQKYVSHVIQRYKMCQKNNTDFWPKSWIDYFLIGNIYVVGFGLNPSEMDIWWLINCKKRHFDNCGKIFFYEPNLDCIDSYPVRALAETFGIKYDFYKVENDYVSFYQNVIDEIRQVLNVV